VRRARRRKAGLGNEVHTNLERGVREIIKKL
jgi:hypothetical protein